MAISTLEQVTKPNLRYMPEQTQGLAAETVRDILTDASERVGYMENSFLYSLNSAGDDLLSDTGTALKPVLEQGILMAEMQAKQDNRWHIEVTRRQIERAQHEAAIAFAKMYGDVRITSLSLDGRTADTVFGDAPLRRLIGELAPELDQKVLEGVNGELDPTKVLNYCFEKEGALWFISMPPACVRQTGEGLGGGYDPQRLKTLVRIVSPIDVHVPVLAAHARATYDAALMEEFGGWWYGGRAIESELSEGNILDFIMSQPALVEMHLARIQNTFGNKLGAPEFATDVYQEMQYNFAAALCVLLQGKPVHSLEAAGYAAKTQGLTFDGDCPVSTLRRAEAQLEALGLLRPKKMHCPFCRSPNVRVENPLDPTCSDKSCRDCGSFVSNGQVVRRFLQRSKKA